MSFIKRLLKRKKGGTFAGNVIRDFLQKKTYGLLGTGDDLKNWEQNNNEKITNIEMGFFSKIFKKKKGGSFFGNLIRKATGKSTKNVNQHIKESDSVRHRRENPTLVNDLVNSVGESVQTVLGKELQPTVQKVAQSNEVKQIQNDMLKDWFKKKWFYIAIPVVAVVGVIVYLSKSKGSR